MTPVTGTSLTLQAALRSAAARVGLGGAARSLAGLSASAKGLAAAAAAAEAPVVVIVPGAGDVEQLVADTRFFLGSLTAASEHELRHHVLAFPSHEVDPYRGLAPHFDVAAARGRALHGLASGTVRVVVAASAALLPRVSAPDRLLAAGTRLVEGAFLEPPDLGDLLADAGFVPEDPVDGHGQFCVRGGVVDFFPAGDEHPIRAEFAGDSLESLRRFDPATQRSTETLDQVEVFPLRELFEPAPGGGPQDGEPDRSAWLRDYLRRVPGVRVYLSESEASRAAAASRLEQAAGSFAEAEAQGEAVPAPEELLVAGPVLDDWLASVPRLEQLWEDQDTAPAAHHVACQPVVEMHGRIGDWAAEIARCRERGDTTLLVAGTPGRAERVIELLADYDLTALSIDHADETHGAALLVATGQLTRGFRLPDAGLQIFAEPDVFDEERRVRERRAGPARSFLSDFRDLKAGDRVVHVDHGVGVFVGLKQIPVGLERHEFMELRYAGEDKLFVPVQQIDLLQKYSGTGKNLDRLGGTSWAKTKTRVRRAMRDMAEELLKLYAARKAMPGHTFSADSHWHREFDDAFEYQLTTDQQSAIEDIRRDMESPVSMDRLLCGDVGYGKTEVAMRAAFKAVMDGKQVGFLAPTTVLAFQHHKTLSDRFAAFPVRIDLVSRFRTRAEQKQTLTDLEAGRVDIIVGTHRLLSKDVRFSDLGLLVVDEEQRFGVAHKERIKQLRRRVDVLTMTATPIPRTLNMSLAGIRDMSVIETPPKDRQSIQTNVVRFDQPLIARAIRTELERGGQVYFLHSRVTSIYAMGELLTRLLPEARIAVAHGQMEEGALERCMVDFVRHQYDVLLATTIIENGLDIPNANTIIVNHAERFGLAQLYQLRGRVGRSDRRAYAYLLVPPEGTLSPVARRRLAAIREFSDLGSGFRVAALDLEIRGAGNLLGGEQSGHIESVGFDMYVKLLDQTVRELKGEEVEEAARAAVNLDIDLKIDEDYIPDTNQRLTVYRRVASARGEAELSALADELRDRYGPVPASIGVLVEYGRIRLLADELGLESIDRNDARLVLKFRTTTTVDPVRLMRFVERRRDLELKPPAMLTVDLRARGAARGPRDSPSWWTARARSGEVEAGFSRAGIPAGAARPGGSGPAPRPRREPPGGVARAPGGRIVRSGRPRPAARAESTDGRTRGRAAKGGGGELRATMSGRR